MGSVCIHLLFSVWNISLTMKEFRSLLCLLLVLPGSLSVCDFRDESLFDGTFDIDQPTTGNDYSVFVDRKLYVWPNHRVPYMFAPSMSKRDRDEAGKLLRTVIDGYRKETCIRFNLYTNSRWNPIPKHHLLIDAKFTYRDCRMRGNVKTGHNWFNNQEMRLSLTLPKKIGGRCRKHLEQLVYHEMGHAMGIMHTQKRRDRKDYVIYDEQCVDPKERSQFTELKENDIRWAGDYECNSIMHYERNTFNRYNCTERNPGCPCNVLTPRPGTKCKAIKPDLVPTETDWAVINVGQSC